MANAFDIYKDDYVSRFNQEWIEVVQRDYNHPSIIAWTPINESWGTFRIATNKLAAGARPRDVLFASFTRHYASGSR